MVEFSRDREIQGFIDLLGCSTSINEKPVPLILNSQYVLNFVFFGCSTRCVFVFTRQLAAERWACRKFLKKSVYPAERKVL